MPTFQCLGKKCMVVRDILLSFGWEEVEEGKPCDLKWAAKASRVDGMFGYHPKSCLVNHFRGCGELDSKSAFMENLQWCQPCASSFFPRSYDLRTSTELHKFMWDLVESRARTLVQCDTADTLLKHVGDESLKLCNHEYSHIFPDRSPGEDIPTWMMATARPFIENAAELSNKCRECRAWQRANAEALEVKAKMDSNVSSSSRRKSISPTRLASRVASPLPTDLVSSSNQTSRPSSSAGTTSMEKISNTSPKRRKPVANITGQEPRALSTPLSKKFDRPTTATSPRATSRTRCSANSASPSRKSHWLATRAHEDTPGRNGQGCGTHETDRSNPSSGSSTRASSTVFNRRMSTPTKPNFRTSSKQLDFQTPEHEDYQYVPRTFEESMAQFSGPQELLAGFHNAWIFKNPHLSRGRGLDVYTGERCLKPLLEEAHSRCCKSQRYFCVAQKYMERPFTVPLPSDGTQVKVDLRLWVFVISWNPLVAYVQKDPYFRLATQPFDFPRSPKSRADPKAHLTNRTVQIEDTAGAGDQDPQNMWLLEKFLVHLDSAMDGGRETWYRKTWPKMLDAVRCCLVATQDAVVAQAEIYGRKVAAKRTPLDGPRAFEMYGFDFALDRDLNPWVLEANVSPDLLPDAGKSLREWSKQSLKEMLCMVTDQAAIEVEDVDEDELPAVERLPACGEPACYTTVAVSQVPPSLVSGVTVKNTSWKLFVKNTRIAPSALMDSYTKRKRALWAMRSNPKSHEQVIREMLCGVMPKRETRFSLSPVKKHDMQTKVFDSLPVIRRKSVASDNG